MAKDVKSAINESFGALDIDNNGKIDKKELCVLFRAVFGMPKDGHIPDELISAIMKEADRDGSGAITKDELSGAVNCMMALQLTFVLEQEFQQLDKDRNGYLDKAELAAVIKGKGNPNQQKRLAKATAELPANTKITKQQFIAAALRQLSCDWH